jgi:hypothetical protein
VEGSHCLRSILQIFSSFPGLLLYFVAIPIHIVLQDPIEPARVLDLLDNILLFTMYLNGRRVPWGATRNFILLVAFKEADMENWMDLVISGQFQVVGAVVNFFQDLEGTMFSVVKLLGRPSSPDVF